MAGTPKDGDIWGKAACTALLIAVYPSAQDTSRPAMHSMPLMGLAATAIDQVDGNGASFEGSIFHFIIRYTVPKRLSTALAAQTPGQSH